MSSLFQLEASDKITWIFNHHIVTEIIYTSRLQKNFGFMLKNKPSNVKSSLTQWTP